MLLRVRKEKCVTFPIQLTEKDYINTRKPSFCLLPSLVSPSPSLSGAAPTDRPHTGGTSGRLWETHDPVQLPKHQSGLLTSFQAKKKNHMRRSYGRVKSYFQSRKYQVAFVSYFWQTFMQLRPLFLLFQEIPSSVSEPCGICGFFLWIRRKTETIIK